MAIRDKAEAYHPVPAIRRAREAALGGKVGAPEHEKEHESDGHGRVVETSVVKHKDGKAHVRAKHEDGHEAIHEHNDEHSAHQHAQHLMSGEGGHEEDAGGSNHEAAEALGAESGGNEESAGAKEECPHCGAEMEEGKPCPQCGYEDKGEEEEEQEY